MSLIDCVIIILIVIIIIIKYYENSNKVEHYTTLWTPFSNANQDIVNTQCTSVNKKSLNKNFGDFGIIGKFPAIPICNSCQLDFDCVNYAYDDVDDRNMNVCRKCGDNVLYKNYNDMSKPLYVNARSAGRPRQCKRIL